MSIPQYKPSQLQEAWYHLQEMFDLQRVAISVIVVRVLTLGLQSVLVRRWKQLHSLGRVVL